MAFFIIFFIIIYHLWQLICNLLANSLSTVNSQFYELIGGTYTVDDESPLAEAEKKIF